MLVVRGTYDGREFRIPDDAKDVLPCRVIVLFEDDEPPIDGGWLGIQERALADVWDDEEQAVFSKL
ncbi:MAG: hypothetical protein ABFC63_11140 [Thermoguttaceae bacterium]